MKWRDAKADLLDGPDAPAQPEWIQPLLAK
jgi:hypothetical protein